MLEVEMKFPAADHDAMHTKLIVLGAAQGGVRSEEDHYFNAPDRDFAQTDEALRLRRIGENNYITYKGPKQDRQTKTRTEIEVALEAGASAAENAVAIFSHLGYRSVAKITKRRAFWHLRRDEFDVEVCLDSVDGVGDFIEVEIVAPESSLDAARQAVMTLARELGLAGSERRSYLEMWLAKHHGS